MQFNKAKRKILIGQLFFFFNCLGLPSPLLWTNLLSLFYLKEVIRSKGFKALLAFLLGLLLFSIVHFNLGVSGYFFYRSLAFFICVAFSTIATYLFIKKSQKQFSKLFMIAAIFGFILFLSGTILMMFDVSWFWKSHNFIVGGADFWRYQALVYEPSFYAYLVTPVLIYFLLKTVSYFSWLNFLLLLATVIPVLLTVSFGFVGVFSIATCLSLVVSAVSYKYFPKLLLYPCLILLGILIVSLSGDNLIGNRLKKIAKGEDTSINGRTTEAFYLAGEMAKSKNVWFGIGLGQIKVIGELYIRPYYGYSKEKWPIVALPNAMAESLATFGLLGFCIRIAIQFYLFYRFKVFQNMFSLFLFMFLFIYQFVGSFIVSSTEYAFWALCLIPVFPELNFNKLIQTKQS